MSVAEAAALESAAAASAAAPRKPRSLDDLMKEQVKEGNLDAKQLGQPVDWNERQYRPRGRPGNDRPQYSDRSDRSQKSSDGLNWQQKELLGKSSNNPSGGEFQQNSHSGFYSKERQSSAPPRRPTNGEGRKPSSKNLPDWASGLETTQSSNSDGLNWQQKMLLSKSDT